MELEVILEELDNCLEKYTRFMAKDVYITKKMYEDFWYKYSYLDQECEKYIELKDNVSYLKFKKIKLRENSFIKHHNKKYIKKHLDVDKEYFDNIYEKVSLSLEDRELIMVMDNVDIKNKNDYQKIMLFLSKIRYLKDKMKYQDKDIIVIVKRSKIKDSLEVILKKYDLKILVYVYSEIIDKYQRDNDVKVIKEREKYRIIEDYFKKKIFSNKELLREYIVNYRYLYFNKDVYDYDTINDYHNYMITRKFIQSGISKKDYMTKIIEKRRSNLLTINDEKVDYLEEVDIANYLYLHNIRYKIIKGDRIYFKIGKIIFCYVDEIDEGNDQEYKLYKKYKSGNLLTHLEDMLRNRQIEGFVMDKNVLRDKIKNSTRDIYYRDFINKIVIPYIDSDNKKDMLLEEIKSYYNSYLEENKLKDNLRAREELENDFEYKAKYMLMDDDHLDNGSVKLIIES